MWWITTMYYPACFVRLIPSSMVFLEWYNAYITLIMSHTETFLLERVLAQDYSLPLHATPHQWWKAVNEASAKLLREFCSMKLPTALLDKELQCCSLAREQHTHSIYTPSCVATHLQFQLSFHRSCLSYHHPPQPPVPAPLTTSHRCGVQPLGQAWQAGSLE